MSTPAAPASPAPAPAPVPPKKSNTLVIVLCVILGIFLLLIASCVGTCLYVGKKAKDYAKESQKNPKISALSLAASIYPGIEVVSKDLDAGTIVLKNKKTGEVIKIDENTFSQDKIDSVLEKIAQGKGVDLNMKQPAASSDSTPSASPSSDEGPSAAQVVAQGATLKSFSADFPVYSGSGVVTLNAAQHSFAGVASSEHSFTTGDSPASVAGFYEKKLVASGFALISSENGSDSNGANSLRVFQKDNGASSFTVNAQIENGKTKVLATLVVLGKK